MKIRSKIALPKEIGLYIWLIWIICIILSAGFIVAFYTPPQVDITGLNSGQQSINLGTDERVDFINSSGAAQILCLGQNHKCGRSINGPSELQTGLQIMPGESKELAFHEPGIYHIISTTQPAVQLTINVSDFSDS